MKTIVTGYRQFSESNCELFEEINVDFCNMIVF